MYEGRDEAPSQLALRWVGRGTLPVLVGIRLLSETSAGVRSIENPATGEQLGLVPECGAVEADMALSAAARARRLGSWPQIPGESRARALYRLADRLEADREVLAALLTLDCGKPLRESRMEVRRSEDLLRHGAAIAIQDLGMLKTEGDMRIETVPRPVGTVVVLGNCGLPLLSLMEPLAAALAAGDAVILKPSELAPLSALRLAEHLLESDLPEGVAQVLTGAGGTLGQALCRDERTDLVVVSGTAETVRAVRTAVGYDRLQPLGEVEGAAVSLVLADADLDAAADRVVLAACLGQGAMPSSAHRLVVEERIHDQLMLRVVNRLSRIVVGNGIDPETELGPLISVAHLGHVAGLLRRAREQGAVQVIGGERPKDTALERGHYLCPALLLGCREEMEISRMKPYAPVLAVESAGDRQAAAQAANRAGPRGLVLGFSQSDDGIRFLRDAVTARRVWINYSGWPASGALRQAQGMQGYASTREVTTVPILTPSGWYRGN